MSRVSATLAPLLIYSTAQARLSGPGPRDFKAALFSYWNEKDKGLGARKFLLDRCICKSYLTPHLHTSRQIFHLAQMMLKAV
ncbi:hypothetical protein BDW67DRAFT_151011 [Aspergillus spinulosporus]